MDHSVPHDPETSKSRRTQAHIPAATNRARAAHEAIMHAAREAGEEQCSMCTRYFPWLHNQSDARCHSCDVLDQHVRRIVREQLDGAPPGEPEPPPDPRGYKCGGCDTLRYSSDICDACRVPKSSRVWPGARVRLHSLTRVELNGRFGTVLDYIGAKHRWAVEVDDPGGGTRILLKQENLERCCPRRDYDSDSAMTFEGEDSDDLCQFQRPWEDSD